MIGRGDDDRVYLFVHFAEHFAEVIKFPGFREVLERQTGFSVVDVAHRHDVRAQFWNGTNKPPPAPSDANKCDVKLFICFVTES